MKKLTVILLLIAFMSFGSFAFAQGEKSSDCDCEKGGLGLKLGNFVCGIGAKTFNSNKGCDTNIGIGLGIGRDDARFQVGVGYDKGVIGVGFGLKDPESTTIFGLSIGYDYGDCQMVWPYVD